MKINNLSKVYINPIKTNKKNSIQDRKNHQHYQHTMYDDSNCFYINDSLLEKIIQNIHKHCTCLFPQFVWYENQDAMLSKEFYKKVVNLQQSLFIKNNYENTIEIENIKDLSEEDVDFLLRNNFLIKININLNSFFTQENKINLYKTEKIIKQLIKSGINTEMEIIVDPIYCVDCVEQIYNFLKENKVHWVSLSIPKNVNDCSSNNNIIYAENYGNILCKFFDLWHYDLCNEKAENNILIKLFDSMLCKYLNGKHTVCYFREKCGTRIFIDSNGDVYPCNLYTDNNKYILGNIDKLGLDDIYNDEKSRKFYYQKEDVNEECKTCKWLSFCNGGCIKNRLFDVENGKFVTNHFCSAYKMFFEHTNDKFQKIANDMKQK